MWLTLPKRAESGPLNCMFILPSTPSLSHCLSPCYLALANNGSSPTGAVRTCPRSFTPRPLSNTARSAERSPRAMRRTPAIRHKGTGPRARMSMRLIGGHNRGRQRVYKKESINRGRGRDQRLGGDVCAQ